MQREPSLRGRTSVGSPPEVTASDVVASSPPPPSSAGADSDAATRPVDFDSWLTANGSDLLRFAFLVLGDRQRAEDAVQEALARACGRWRRVGAADDPRAYVRRMVVNADISWWRKFGRREQPVEEVRTPDARVAIGTVDLATVLTEVDAMWRLCAELPRRQRAAVVLRYYEGLPDAEIARVLGCAEGTVRSQIHRALATLRARLSEQERRHG